jgi:dTDP-4-dehydrorhamnose reductase
MTEPRRIVVLGGGGMLGHKVFQTLSARWPDTWTTLRGTRAALPAWAAPIFPPERLVEGLDAMDLAAVDALLERLRPDVVVNCVGAIKQRDEARNPLPSITLNALLPHRLAAAVAGWGGRVIHFSTDCVFSGRRGSYTEADPSDAEDLYGKTKFLGEVAAPNALTLRTSIIGRELSHHHSLLDWFLSQEGGRVRGFTRAWWSGVTTNHLAGFVAEVIERHPGLQGLYQLSSGRISKYDLLLELRAGLGLEVEVEPDDAELCDRSLVGARLEAATGYRTPPWEALIAGLAQDPTPYPTMKTSTR